MLSNVRVNIKNCIYIHVLVNAALFHHFIALLIGKVTLNYIKRVCSIHNQFQFMCLPHFTCSSIIHRQPADNLKIPGNVKIRSRFSVKRKYGSVS